MIDSFAKLLVFQALGEGLAFLLAIPIPGPVIGMVLLLIYLLIRAGEVEKLTSFSTQFLSHLALLFVPAAAGIILHVHRIADEWIPITAALMISTVVSIVVTAVVVRWLEK
jgi:holin-like protein